MSSPATAYCFDRFIEGPKAKMSNGEIDRLKALAAFTPRLSDLRVPFGTWQPMTGSGAREDPHTLPWFSLSELGHDFVAMAYETGWILKDFDWATWAHGPEGQLIANDRAALASADAQQLAKLLTAVVRQDRFVEGALSNAYDTGLLLALAKRAQTLCGANEAS